MTLVRPTFFGIYTARSGIVASQANIDVTGHNLANILTPGYTRQRANLTSVGDSGYKNRLASRDRIYIGQGVDVNSLSQLRDAGYDIRYRLENTKYGYEETKLSGLEDLTRAMDEFFLTDDKDGDLKGIFGALAKVVDAIQSETGDSDNTDEKSTVYGAMSVVTKMLQETARKVDSVYNQQVDDFGITVDKINTTLQQIAALNKQIYEDALYNNPALELKDDRNMLLDELSGYLNIEYKYDASKLDELSVNFVNADGTKLPLIQGDKFTTIDLHTEADTDVAEIPHLLFKFDEKMKLPATLQPGTAAVAVTDADCDSGAVGAYFDLLTGKGNFGAATEMRGIPYYQNMLDTYAKTLAQSMNDLNRGKVSWNAEKGEWQDLNGSPVDFLTNTQLRDMTDADGNLLNWQKNPKMKPDDWNNLTAPNDIANLIAHNQKALDALGAGATYKDATGQTITKQADGTWQDGAGNTVNLSRTTADELKSLKNADGTDFAWQKYQVTPMNEADWNNVNDDNLANVLAVNKDALDKLKDGATYTTAAGEIIKKEGKDWKDDDGNVVKPPTTKAEWQSLQVDNAPFAWQKQTVDVEPTDWENMTKEELAEIVELNKDMLKDGVYLFGKDYELLTFGDESGQVTANNIVATETWQKDKHILQHTLKEENLNASDDNLSRMITFFNRKNIDFNADDGKNIYVGGMSEFMSNLNITLGSDTAMSQSFSKTALQNVNTLEENRMSISGVDENEEAANMMMFQKAFTASARIMTAMDEMLNTLINNTGVVGR